MVFSNFSFEDQEEEEEEIHQILHDRTVRQVRWQFANTIEEDDDTWSNRQLGHDKISPQEEELVLKNDVTSIANNVAVTLKTTLKTTTTTTTTMDRARQTVDEAIGRIRREVALQREKSNSMCHLRTAHNW